MLFRSANSDALRRVKSFGRRLRVLPYSMRFVNNSDISGGNFWRFLSSDIRNDGFKNRRKNFIGVFLGRYVEISRSNGGNLLSPLTPPYAQFGIRRFNLTSKHDARRYLARFLLSAPMDSTFRPSYCRTAHGTYVLIARLRCSALRYWSCLPWLLPTSHSSLLLRLKPLTRSRGISSRIFSRLSS